MGATALRTPLHLSPHKALTASDKFLSLLQAMADLLTMAGNAFETGLKNTGQAVQNLGNRIGAGVGGSSCSCDENGCGCGGAKCGCFHGGQCTCCGTQCPGCCAGFWCCFLGAALTAIPAAVFFIRQRE